MQHVLTVTFYISGNDLMGNTVSSKEFELHWTFIVFFLAFVDIDLLFKEGTWICCLLSLFSHKCSFWVCSSTVQKVLSIWLSQRQFCLIRAEKVKVTVRFTMKQSQFNCFRAVWECKGRNTVKCWNRRIILKCFSQYWLAWTFISFKTLEESLLQYLVFDRFIWSSGFLNLDEREFCLSYIIR